MYGTLTIDFLVVVAYLTLIFTFIAFRGARERLRLVRASGMNGNRLWFARRMLHYETLRIMKHVILCYGATITWFDSKAVNDNPWLFYQRNIVMSLVAILLGINSYLSVKDRKRGYARFRRKKS